VGFVEMAGCAITPTQAVYPSMSEPVDCEAPCHEAEILSLLSGNDACRWAGLSRI